MVEVDIRHSVKFVWRCGLPLIGKQQLLSGETETYTKVQLVIIVVGQFCIYAIAIVKE